jgi:protein-S-isoprenylcysteine O-methyltransferase Ste14
MPYLLVTSIFISAVALLLARREYRKRGKLSFLGLFLLCAMLFLPNLMLDYATIYSLPGTMLDWLGVAIAAAGLVLCFGSIMFFKSISKVLCLNTGELTLSGPYRWSRNPQYVGWFLFLVGFSLTDWSPWCGVALALVAVSLHLLVLIEEEHLRRVFGEPYLEFCRRVPRYLGWRNQS